MIQRGPEWAAWRAGGLGGSDAPAVMGVSPYMTPRQLWLQKTGQAPPPADNDPAFQWGHRYEEEARRAFEAHTGSVVEPCTLEHAEWPIMRASLDGLSWDRDEAVEIKAPNAKDHADAEAGRVPTKYWPQCQHNLAVCGASVLHYWSYRPAWNDRPASGVLVTIHPDPDYIADLIAKEREFWGYVERREMPPGFVPPEDERTDTDWVETARLYREAEAGYAEWDGKRKAARERLITLAGQSTRQQGGGLTLTKLRKSGGYDTKRLIEEWFGQDSPRHSYLEKYRLDGRDEYRVTIAKGGK